MAISIADSSCSSPRSSLGFLLDPVKVEPPRPKQSMWHRLGLRRWLGRDDRDFSRSPAGSSDSSPRRSSSPPPPQQQPKSHDNLTRRLSRRVGVGLPRSTTFKRQQSERRDRLSPASSSPPRRAASADREQHRRTLSLERTKSPQSVVDPRLSAPEINWREDPIPHDHDHDRDHHPDPDPEPDFRSSTKVDDYPESNKNDLNLQHSDARAPEWDQYHPHVTDTPEGYPVDNLFDMELERRWILNLSMHFRDRSEREKFFVTYAETANRWRRVTISCDYRDAEPESLEQDLKELRYQRDKCARIYESIRESLPDIQFYDTVTNLKLETRDGRLHVHVTEDVNEIIPYPPISSIGHLPEAQLIPERRLNFEAHLSGFVYNVKLDGRSFIKKEIPGPDTVDEFLYEINALHALQGTPNVIQVEGVVVDDRQEVVKGLLISFAEKGALVDILYECRGTISWERRERWAKQIVHGLCEIHEAGYVQGDFTLSNIVVDGNDDAKIIDINRRGCPVGWEPPEIAAKIESNQRISMYIGVKTDLFQLGMTLWALAMEEDEPERQRRPFTIHEDLPIPDYYRRLVAICLSPIPRRRLSAKELLTFFPLDIGAFDNLPRRHPHTSMGVGLHNGALPLYDSRAAFMYPRGRQMGSFGYSNTHTPQQPPLDSFESIPSPETDRSYFSREESERERYLYDRRRQPNGDWRSESMSVDDQNSVDDIITSHPAQQEDIRELHRNPSLEYESEIDLDAGVDPRYRTPSTDMTTVEPMLNTKPLPIELAGVGTWKTPSHDGSIQYQPPEPLTTQAPVDIYPVLIRDSAAEFLSGPESSEPVSTLSQSALPINPAAEFEQGPHLTADPQVLTSVTAEDTKGDKEKEPNPLLSDYVLPISPAVQLAEEILNEKLIPQPPTEVQSTFEHSKDNPPSLRLKDSLLPINPAAKLPESPPTLEIQTQLEVRTTVPPPLETFLRVSQDQSALNESCLPINPATELPKDIFDVKPVALPIAVGQPSQPSQDVARDNDQDFFLSNSTLPINPATISLEKETVSYPIDVKPAASVQSTLAPRDSDSSQFEDTLLSSSLLPINPTIASKEEIIRHEIEVNPAPVPQPASIPERVNENQDRSFFLSNSHLPINPATIPENETLIERTDFNVLPTPPPQQDLPNPPHHLNDSHLPINPAFIDKVIHPV
ncbi:hypothetical protein BDV19DRAFT_374446 [Aspergillus venezuelensis]